MAVTSPAPGDGKTSLVTSLGLSYAATGARTLLIDSDLIGAGLTTRVNSIVRRKVGAILLREKLISEKQLTEALDLAQRQGKRLGEVLTALGWVKEGDLERALSIQKESSLGLLDVLDGEPLSDCLINGWAPNLSVLPMGNVGANHAGQISLRAVRRIIAEARANFDVVLVDTGPILGSLEACILAAAVDEVIVTVARGQQRPLVEKTFSRLREIGAKIAGIVFNRAASDDLERGGYSGSATSQRYHSPGFAEEVNGTARMRRLGPVAWAVAGDANESHEPGDA
jgi:Mrp family chromosome partitioning ATPase